MFWILVQCIMSFIRDACFSVSHWLFAFEYFTIQIITPYILKGQTVPIEMTEKHEKVAKIFLYLNIIVPAVSSIASFVMVEFIYHAEDQVPPTEPWNGWAIIYELSRNMVFALQIISGFFLGIAICKI